jgi:hypothetical protein
LFSVEGSMATTEWSLFSRMIWKRCPKAQGYTRQGGAIVARPVNPPSAPAQLDNPPSAAAYLLGPRTEDQTVYAMEEYCPDEENRMAHREFLALKMGDDEGLLAFVNTYGLLGLDGGGPPKRESLAHLWLAHTHLWFYAHGSQDAQVSVDKRNDHFNNFCPQHMSVYLDREKGSRTVLKTKVGSLLAWMWLRLAQEAVGEIKPRNCKLPTCDGQWYEGPKLSSSRREYCDADCKSAHHYGMRTGKFPKEPKPAKKGGSK